MIFYLSWFSPNGLVPACATEMYSYSCYLWYLNSVSLSVSVLVWICTIWDRDSHVIAFLGLSPRCVGLNSQKWEFGSVSAGISNEANEKKRVQRNILKCQYASKPHVPRHWHSWYAKQRHPCLPLLSNLGGAVCHRSDCHTETDQAWWYVYRTNNFA